MEPEKESQAAPSSVPETGLPFPIVGIGASAGGYAALMTLLQNLPPNPGMALVVILHLAADEPSAADKVLQRATAMPVVQVAHTMPILPNHVYVIPPDRSLAMDDGHLVLDQLERSCGRPVAIDMFMRTLATAHKERAIGVVLSGMGTDGTAGLACIKETGGATIAQLPSDAEYGSMPRSAIESGTADFVLAASAIPARLAELRDVADAIRRRALQGHLMLGGAESIEAATHLFAPVDAARRIYRARPAAMALPAQASPFARAAEAAPVQRRGRLFSFAEIHLHKAAELAPPSILLNADADILHVSERAARFLRSGAGEPTRELLALVLPPLQLALRAALFQARRSGRQAGTGQVRYEGEGGTHAVDMQVLPFQDPHAEGELLLVEFREPPVSGTPADATDAADPAAAHAPREDGALLRQLGEELRHARKQLHDTVEQTEVSNGEMRIHAEEMQTTMEELRSGGEAVERGRTELLSANQELVAANRELRRRAQESSKAHDDLANLVASSGVATIFLDRDMRILRYTPRIADFFNVRPSDVGRPLLHITNRLDYPGLAEDAAAVFGTLQALEREVRSKDGRDYIVRVHPCRTTTDRIEGAVMSFFDITSRKHEEEERRASEARLSTVFERLPVGVCVMGANGTMLLSNRIMHRYLPTGVMPSLDPERGNRWRAWDADGRPVPFHDFPGARALRGERVVPGIEMLFHQDDGREIWTQVASSPVSDDSGHDTGEVMVVVTDIDALKRAEVGLAGVTGGRGGGG